MELGTRDPPPESVPVNVLSKVPWTPMADQPDLPVWEVVRTIAVARILMPRSMVRLGAGRQGLSAAERISRLNKELWISPAPTTGLADKVNEEAQKDIAKSVVPEEGAIGFIDGPDAHQGSEEAR